MRYRVLPKLKIRAVTTTALLLAAGVSAGCSGDAMRLSDSFYDGAVPQAGQNQYAANAGGLDGTTTGSINQAPASGGFYGDQTAYAQQVASAPAPNVQRGQLPPPSAYQQPGSVPSYPSATQQATPSTNQALGSQGTSLNDQARQIGNAQAPQNTAPASASGPTVTVASGDTLSGIARRSGVSAQAIRNANGMSGDTVRLGQQLVIPTSAQAARASQQAEVQSTPTPTETPGAQSGLASQAATSAPAAKQASSAQQEKPAATETRVASIEPSAPVSPAKASQSSAEAPESSGIGKYRWPVQGRVLSRFGEKVNSKRNDGLNISVPRGTPVKAAENGTVIYAGDGLKEFGNTVLVKHADGLVTVYGNADSLDVKVGDQVKRGQQIASSGMTGDATVPQLHFEVRKNSSPIDPSSYLQ